MKFSIYVLLLALGVSGRTCADSNECDVASHLATRTQVKKVSKAQEILFSELFSSITLTEISGPPGVSFNGCIWVIGFPSDFVSQAPSEVTGTFDANGLLLVQRPPFQRPQTWFLSETCPSQANTIDDLDVSTAGQIYDSIGVPTFQEDDITLENRRLQLNVPGTDLKFTGTIPTQATRADLVFRDASVGDWYVVNDLGSAPIFDANAIEVDAGDFDGNALGPTLGFINPSYEGGAIGDPHIHTLAGDHYTLLREGSFLLWQFGLEKPKVQWQLYAHYAGRQSFTKGLLLLDTSGPKPSTMEITSEKCQWQTQGEAKEWSTVTSVVLSTSYSRIKLVEDQHEEVKKIQLFLTGENSPVARLIVMCRPGHHINLKLAMNKKKWGQFVSGELKGEQQKPSSKTMKISALQLDAKEDQEFQVKKTWKELGGSSHAEQYLQNFGEHPGQTISLIQTCDSQAEAEARVICRKHLGETSKSAYFKECVFDVCSGAGEVAAEMAAEMLRF